MKKIICMVMMCVMFAGVFSSCGSDDLNENEKKIYDCIVANIGDFDDPKSVKIMKCTEIKHDGDIYGSDTWCLAQIKSKNKEGEIVTKNYHLDLDDNGSHSMISEGILEKAAVESGDGIDVGKINKAVSDYCDKKGW